MSKPSPFRSLLYLCVVAGAASACDGGSGAGDGGNPFGNDAGSTPSTSSSGVDGTKTISSLTQADLKKFCDWTASLYGGYGGQKVCSTTETIIGPASQAECLAQAAAIPATCKATVSQVETCTQMISTCDTSSLATSPACAAMATCVS